MPEGESVIDNPSGGSGGAGKTMECKECGSVHYASGDFDLKRVSQQRKNERKKMDESEAEIAKLKKEIENRDAQITQLKDELREAKVSGTGGGTSKPFFLGKGA